MLPGALWREDGGERESVMIHRETTANSTSVQPGTPPPPLRPAGELGDWWWTGLGWDGLARDEWGVLSMDVKEGCRRGAELVSDWGAVTLQLRPCLHFLNL